MHSGRIVNGPSQMKELRKGIPLPEWFVERGLFQPDSISFIRQQPNYSVVAVVGDPTTSSQLVRQSQSSPPSTQVVPQEELFFLYVMSPVKPVQR